MPFLYQQVSDGNKMSQLTLHPLPRGQEACPQLKVVLMRRQMELSFSWVRIVIIYRCITFSVCITYREHLQMHYILDSIS